MFNIKTVDGEKFTLTSRRLTELVTSETTYKPVKGRYVLLADVATGLSKAIRTNEYGAPIYPAITIHNVYAPYFGNKTDRFNVRVLNGNLFIGCKQFSPATSAKILTAASGYANKNFKGVALERFNFLLEDAVTTAKYERQAAKAAAATTSGV